MAGVSQQMLEQVAEHLVEMAHPELTSVSVHRSIYAALHREVFGALPTGDLVGNRGSWCGVPIHILHSATPMFADGTCPAIATFSDSSIRVLRIKLH